MFISFAEEKIEIETVNDELKIKCKNYRTKINTQTSVDFPLIPTIENESCFFVKTSDFKKNIGSVSFAVSSGEGRPEISGIFFSFVDSFFNTLCFFCNSGIFLVKKLQKVI